MTRVEYVRAVTIHLPLTAGSLSLLATITAYPRLNGIGEYATLALGLYVFFSVIGYNAICHGYTARGSK